MGITRSLPQNISIPLDTLAGKERPRNSQKTIVARSFPWVHFRVLQFCSPRLLSQSGPPHRFPARFAAPCLICNNVELQAIGILFHST